MLMGKYQALLVRISSSNLGILAAIWEPSVSAGTSFSIIGLSQCPHSPALSVELDQHLCRKN